MREYIKLFKFNLFLIKHNHIWRGVFVWHVAHSIPPVPVYLPTSALRSLTVRVELLAFAIWSHCAITSNAKSEIKWKQCHFWRYDMQMPMFLFFFFIKFIKRFIFSMRALKCFQLHLHDREIDMYYTNFLIYKLFM